MDEGHWWSDTEESANEMEREESSVADDDDDDDNDDNDDAAVIVIDSILDYHDESSRDTSSDETIVEDLFRTDDSDTDVDLEWGGIRIGVPEDFIAPDIVEELGFSFEDSSASTSSESFASEMLDNIPNWFSSDQDSD